MGGASPLHEHKTTNVCSKAHLVSDLEMFSSPQTCITMVGNCHLPPRTGLCSQMAETLVCLCPSNTINPQTQQSLSRKCVCICHKADKPNITGRAKPFHKPPCQGLTLVVAKACSSAGICQIPQGSQKLNCL